MPLGESREGGADAGSEGIPEVNDSCRAVYHRREMTKYDGLTGTLLKQVHHFVYPIARRPSLWSQRRVYQGRFTTIAPWPTRSVGQPDDSTGGSCELQRHFSQVPGVWSGFRLLRRGAGVLRVTRLAESARTLPVVPGSAPAASQRVRVVGRADASTTPRDASGGLPRVRSAGARSLRAPHRQTGLLQQLL